MKVIHISTSDTRGGAARAAFRLHQGLRETSSDSSMFVAVKDSDDATVHQYRPDSRLRRRAGRAFRRERVRRAYHSYLASRPSGLEHFRDDRTEFGGEVLRQLPAADILNLHWIAGFIDYQSFFPRAAISRPVVWTLHDMNPFTGGCHFDEGCGRFAAACGSCPQLGSTRPDDLARRIWNRKKRALEKTSPERLFLVAPSNWLAAEARRSSIFSKFSVTVIPYGVDTEVFRPKAAHPSLRSALEIPERVRVVLFLADYTDNRRKGFALLDRALQRLGPTEDLFLLSLGQGSPVTAANIPHLHLGSLTNDSLLATIYSLADVFIIPSIQDNLPNTVLESMACGTPVVGFDTGGIRDMICDGDTGFLVPTGDTDALGSALVKILKDPQARSAMGRRCRERALKEFSHELQARRYSRLYEALLDEPLEASPAVGAPAAEPAGSGS